jgi:hypothetical protein
MTGPLTGSFADDPDRRLAATDHLLTTATYAFYRDGFTGAATRLHPYTQHANSAVLDEPATARALARTRDPLFMTCWPAPSAV